ncbi:DNA recombination protein RmuC [Lapillicoccus jejuensis]|uniref:DNA recombination protein RmuC n=1 Tax=Lapillicoccus jejuensis TaxID=402171 RepID=A0A542DWE3_9MICO|nr:DNA recombination protein RmuC [Lapillicoccus jejuensis]TQJ07409.1 DNA recombination protein RmuC [Lapillicoccus jejuensis]
MGTTALLIIVVALLALGLGATAGWTLAQLRATAAYGARTAAAEAERDVLRERVVDLEASLGETSETAALLAPLRASLDTVARQVHDLERDRGDQFARVATELSRVRTSTTELGERTATLVGSLQASSVRGAWGEVQLRRVLELSGLLARCDFDEQPTLAASDGRRLRPDVVVHLPGGKHLAVDAKAPMSSFLAAQAEGLDDAERRRLLGAHAKALRGHVDTLAERGYWAALDVSPEMVVCFVPTEAMLTAALAAAPGLHEHAMRRRVVLASPATLFALVRTVAFAWQQEALAGNARELLAVGRELHDRLGQLGRHTAALGGALRRSVESYNAFVGSLESRVLVSSRRMQELGLVGESHPVLEPVTSAPRPLTALELLEALEPDVARPELELPADGTTGGGESRTA